MPPEEATRTGALAIWTSLRPTASAEPATAKATMVPANAIVASPAVTSANTTEAAQAPPWRASAGQSPAGLAPAVRRPVGPATRNAAWATETAAGASAMQTTPSQRRRRPPQAALDRWNASRRLVAAWATASGAAGAHTAPLARASVCPARAAVATVTAFATKAPPPFGTPHAFCASLYGDLRSQAADATESGRMTGLARRCASCVCSSTAAHALPPRGNCRRSRNRSRNRTRRPPQTRGDRAVGAPWCRSRTRMAHSHAALAVAAMGAVLHRSNAAERRR
mmetsp:Transcript_113801/g.321845  ORF Transcript_113801/g.321845 Transcript_113801/m.321845 type:complete len:281 (+) Transcript_113801:1102-1944(+)